jgi:hypothetical protein
VIPEHITVLKKRDIKYEQKEKMCPSPVSEKTASPFSEKNVSSVTKSSSENSVDNDTEVSVVKVK